MTTSSKPQVLFVGDLDHSLPEYQAFREKFECIDYRLTTKEELLENFKTKFSNISAIYGAWLGFVPFKGFRNDILENAPASLKVISICSVGFDGYDGKKLREKNIVLTNVPSTSAAEPVADLVLCNAILSFRHFQVYKSHFNLENNSTLEARKILDESSSFDTVNGSAVRSTAQGYSFGQRLNDRACLNPRGHAAVVVGFGNIGQTIGKKLSDLGMDIHYVKRSKLSDEQEAALGYKAQYHSSVLDTKEFADLIVIACPATPETHHLINADVIGQISKPFRIINIGRGNIIDEQALVDGLKTGKVLFAGLDVFEREPVVNPELFDRQDVVLTPHIGASTVENFDYTAIQAMKNIEDVVLNGGSGINTVN